MHGHNGQESDWLVAVVARHSTGSSTLDPQTARWADRPGARDRFVSPARRELFLVALGYRFFITGSAKNARASAWSSRKGSRKSEILVRRRSECVERMVGHTGFEPVTSTL
jgi:hypothetical protein